MKAILFFLMFTCTVLAQNTEITILHTGDSHSHLDAFGPKNASLQGTIGGISKSASLIKSVKTTEPNVLLLHSGDFSVGDFFFNKYFGVPELQIMNQLGYDAVTVGNHEFDLGSSTLYSVLYESFQGGSFPVVSANLDMSGLPGLSNYVFPYTIKTISGVKIGIFGMTIPSPLGNPYPVVIQENIPEIAFAKVSELKSQGVDVVIMLSHLGWGIDSAIAANIPGINFIVGGHDHLVFRQPKSVVNPEGLNTYVVQAGENYEFVGKLKFSCNAGIVSLVNYSLLHADAYVQPDPEVQGIVDYLKAGIVQTYGDVYGTVLGYAAADIVRTDNACNPLYKDSPMGNLITDSYRNKTGTDIAITATGMISQGLYKGAVNGSDVFHCVAYGFDTTTGLDFNLLKMKINGTELIKGLEIGLSQLGISEDFFLQVSGMSFKYNQNNPVGSRVVVSSVRIGDQQFNPAKSYSLTVSEGLYGILLMMGVQVDNVELTGIPEFIALKDFIMQLGTVKYVSEGRIRRKSNNESDSPKNSNKINGYRLFNNFPNPFNPVTTIKYQIPIDENVTLSIYNSAGQELEKLVFGVQKAGIYSYSWNGSRYSSGVYFYKLTVGNFTDVKKMIFIK